MSSLSDMLAADLAAIAGETDEAGVAATYTPSGGEGVSCSVLAGPEDVQLFDNDGNVLAKRGRAVTIAKADVATVAIGAQLTIGSVTYGVRDIIAETDVMTRALCVSQQRDSVGAPDRHLHGY